MVHQNLGHAALALLALASQHFVQVPFPESGTLSLTRPGIRLTLKQQARELVQCMQEKKTLILCVCVCVHISALASCVCVTCGITHFSYNTFPITSLQSLQNLLGLRK